MRLPSVEYIIRIEVTDIMKKILNLFLTFLKIGAFTFGGGYAMIALLEHEFIDKKGWLDHDEFLDMTAIAEQRDLHRIQNCRNCRCSRIDSGRMYTVVCDNIYYIPIF